MRKYLLLLLGVLLIILGGLAILDRSFDDIEESETTGLRAVHFGLSGTPDILDVAYFIADEEGYFRREGLDVNFRQMDGDVVSVQALLSGDLDVTSAGHFAALSAISRGAPIKAIGAIVNSHDYSIVANRDVRRVEDLRGRKVGIFAEGDITKIVMQARLLSSGINQNEVDWISVGGSDNRLRALLSGQVDAVPLHMDFTLKALSAETDLHELGRLSEEQPLLHSVVLIREANLEDSTLPAGIVNALINANKAALQDRDMFVRVAKIYLSDLTDDEIRGLYERMRDLDLFATEGGLTRDKIERGISVAREVGNIEGQLPVSDVVELRFIESIR